MKKTGGQLARAVKRCRVEWDRRLGDPRHARGRRHRHLGLLNLLVLGFASGLTTLRRIEELSKDLSGVTRRLLGLAKRVSDSTLYLLLASQTLDGLRQTLVTQVRGLWRSKRIGNDLFPLGVLALDGKSVWTSAWKSIEGAKEAVSDDGIVISSLAMLNAVLVSSSARPCLDLQLIREKSGESPAFREMVRRVADTFFTLFDVVTGDAGLMCRENALVLRGLKKHFVLAVKGNQQKLFDYAAKAFAASGSPARLTTTERRSGATITRTLHTLTVNDVESLGIYDAQELWRVEQVTVTDAGARSAETRFFISSLPPKQLKPSEKLGLVRLHWGIENNRHWTMDAIFKEDDRQPCQLSRRSVEVGCWLRALSYNLVATLRSAAEPTDGRAQPWCRTSQLLRDMLVGSRPEVLPAHLA
jgi:hypothetical protein